MADLGQIFPAHYQIKTFWEVSQGEIYAEWLQRTNRALYAEIKAYDWTARMYDKPIPIENIRHTGGGGLLRPMRLLVKQ